MSAKAESMCEHVEWEPETVEILSVKGQALEIEAECICGVTLYDEILAEDLEEL